MKVTYRIDGISETKEALQELPKRLQKAALLRVLKMAAEPIRAAAASLAPRDTGELADSMVIATGFDSSVGKDAYAAVMHRGGTKRQAAAALRSARHQSGSVAIPFVWVGPAAAATKKDAIKRIVQEFGSKFQRPQPYMRPAFDSQAGPALRIITTAMAAEVQRTVDRLQAKLARIAAKK